MRVIREKFTLIFNHCVTPLIHMSEVESKLGNYDIKLQLIVGLVE